MMHARPTTPHTEKAYVPEYERSQYDLNRLGWAIQHARCGKFTRAAMAKALGMSEALYRDYELDRKPWFLDTAQRMFRKVGYEFRVISSDGLDMGLAVPHIALKALIFRSGLSKTAFAAKAGVSNTALNNMLTHGCKVSIETLQKICRNHGLTVILRKSTQI